ncbi:hypothetical protein [Azospirillum canadense]|uniref:hypothetical protein n=1 Tax=Azospirillum canadense TaxID=403962 RepID=UPI0022276316|nr:hypothetical protein [Azospirillum canadense]MCW2242028.1 hypothetical protein [Azospirillum canadense]
MTRPTSLQTCRTWLKGRADVLKSVERLCGYVERYGVLRDPPETAHAKDSLWPIGLRTCEPLRINHRVFNDKRNGTKHAFTERGAISGSSISELCGE